MPKIRPFEFFNYVSEEGYEWRKDRRGKLWLVPAELGREDIRVHKDFPTEPLFMEFGALGALAGSDKEQPEAFLAFANAHGTLGIAKEVNLPGVGKMMAESFEDWGLEAFRMAEHLRGWRVVSYGSLDEINAFLRNYGEARAEVHTVNPRGGRVYGNLEFDLVPENAPKHVKREIARRNVIQIGIADMTDKLFGEVSVRPIYYEDGLELRIHPHNLIACLWVQLAVAEDGSTEHRTCEQCGSYFLVNTQAGDRRSRRYCKDACKSAAYRERKQQAERKPRRSTARRRRATKRR